MAIKFMEIVILAQTPKEQVWDLYKCIQCQWYVFEYVQCTCTVHVHMLWNLKLPLTLCDTHCDKVHL